MLCGWEEAERQGARGEDSGGADSTARGDVGVVANRHAAESVKSSSARGGWATPSRRARQGSAD